MPYFNSEIDYESATGSAVGFAANLNHVINLIASQNELTGGGLIRSLGGWKALKNWIAIMS